MATKQQHLKFAMKLFGRCKTASELAHLGQRVKADLERYNDFRPVRQHLQYLFKKRNKELK